MKSFTIALVLSTVLMAGCSSVGPGYVGDR